MAKGSHTTRGGWEPKTCAICNRPIVFKHDGALRFHLNHLTHAVYAWHGECEQPGWPHLEEKT